MFIVGITGGIGTGKSRVADIFRSRGVKVLDADDISREVTGVGGAALPEIRGLLGSKAVDSDLSMNRKYVASLVFSDRTKLDQLSRIIHRRVLEQIAIELEAEKEKGTKLVVLDVPIPVRKGFIDICNQVWVISADESIRLDRLVDRGMDLDDAKRRMSMQMTREEYEDLADIVIINDGTEEDLLHEVEKHIAAQLHERGIRI
jgi:dephospho-CoA kinase